jgi:site-specific DNA recombinase
MRAAIYARKSTDDNDRDDANKSVTRQVDVAREYAERKGWTVDDTHVYMDDGISGAEYQNRPGLLRLMNHVKEFDVLVMSESSRLGRDMTRNATYVVDILESDVRIFYYLTDEEEKADTPEQKIMLTLRSYASEVERQKASQRARDALAVKARKGYNTGGIVYGYDNIAILAANGSGEQVKSHTDYRVNEEQADVVRRLFRMYADGHGHMAIAKTMNGSPEYAAKSQKYFDGLRPTPPRKGTRSWAPSSVRAMLYNERYIGRIPFGEFRNAWRKGTQTRIRQPKSEIIKAERPDLRIVPQELWIQVQDRLTTVAKTYLRDTGGQLWGRPGRGHDSKYLLTGNARCACCGANMTMIGGRIGIPGKRKPCFYYGCSYNHNRGESVCSNGQRIRMEVADEAVLAAIQDRVLTPAALEYVVDRAAEIVRKRQASNPDLPERLNDQLRQDRRKLDNFLALIAEGKAPASVMAKIEQLEGQIAAFEKRLEELLVALPAPADLDRLKASLRSRLAQFKELIRADVPKARQALRKLLKEPLAFKPMGDGGYSIRGEMQVGALLAQAAAPQNKNRPFSEPVYVGMASPRGFEPRSSP